MSIVLDSSALLAYLQQERGAQRVRQVLDQAVMSTVNWAEVVGKARTAADRHHWAVAQSSKRWGFPWLPFSVTQAEIAGSLVEVAKPLGLSLGDRACLAVAMDRREKVYTADRAWSALTADLPGRDDPLNRRR